MGIALDVAKRRYAELLDLADEDTIDEPRWMLLRCDAEDTGGDGFGLLSDAEALAISAMLEGMGVHLAGNAGLPREARPLIESALAKLSAMVRFGLEHQDD